MKSLDEEIARTRQRLERALRRAFFLKMGGKIPRTDEEIEGMKAVAGRILDRAIRLGWICEEMKREMLD